MLKCFSKVHLRDRNGLFNFANDSSKRQMLIINNLFNSFYILSLRNCSLLKFLGDRQGKTLKKPAKLRLLLHIRIHPYIQYIYLIGACVVVVSGPSYIKLLPVVIKTLL